MLVEANKNVFVRAMNPSADTLIIYPGTIVAQVSPVQEVVNPNSKIDTSFAKTSGSLRGGCFFWMCRPCSNVMLYYAFPSIIAI
jgi:hypothetical protein